MFRSSLLLTASSVTEVTELRIWYLAGDSITAVFLDDLRGSPDVYISDSSQSYFIVSLLVCLLIAFI